jgi:hypothetical protein
MTRDEIAAQVSATKDLPLDEVHDVLAALAEMGVPVDTLVKMLVDED